MKSKEIIFQPISKIDNDNAILSSLTSMPKCIAWPKNSEGKLLQCIAHIPTSFLNEHLGLKLQKDCAISVFTYYDREGYFLDKIVYCGDNEEYKIVKDNTRVIFHEIGKEFYTLNDIEIPLHKIIAEKNIQVVDFYGSKLGGEPTLLQKNELEIKNSIFLLQLYGSDFPTGLDDLFYLSDALGYLYIAPNISINSEAGNFFVQTT